MIILFILFTGRQSESESKSNLRTTGFIAICTVKQIHSKINVTVVQIQLYQIIIVI